MRCQVTINKLVDSRVVTGRQEYHRHTATDQGPCAVDWQPPVHRTLE